MKTIVVIILLLLVSCGQDKSASGSEAVLADMQMPAIYTVNYPLAWMAERLAGDAARVVFPAPTDVDPAFWQPDIDTILEYQQGDLILLNGANYAKWMAHVSLPASRLIDTSAGYRKQLIALDADPVHRHGPVGEHSHGGLAFTTWLDLVLAQRQLQAVAGVLQRLLPQDSGAIEQRLAAGLKELDDMDVRMTALEQKLDGAPLLYSHPVYQYLQRRYLLNGKALHWEPDLAPDANQWQELADLLQSHPARIMLWEDEPLPQVATRLDEMGIQVVVFTPLGNRPAQGNFSSNMKANIHALEMALY
ncbi:MAG: metal ABC transporter substrate-binding protein [Porticoccus sp.]|nr:metal ABC transporter substrate-binding protein [Porticoccus sp.]